MEHREETLINKLKMTQANTKQAYDNVDKAVNMGY